MARSMGTTFRLSRVSRAACGGALFTLSLLGCAHEDESGPSAPKLGSSLEGGTVVAASLRAAGCFSVTVQYESDWNCTAEQEKVATTARTTSVPPPADDDPRTTLSETTCHALAELRRAALKQPYLAQLEGLRQSQLALRCIGRRATFLVDPSGHKVASCEPAAGSPTRATGSPTNYAASPTQAPAAGGPASPAGNPAAPSPNAGASVPSTPAAPQADAGSGASEHSTTNTQVEGVDEPDFVKNDDEQVYVLSAHGLHVVDAWPAEEMREIARVRVDGEPRRLFLEGDILAVYSRLGDATPLPGGVQRPSAQGCTYGYQCRYTGEGGRTLITLFDVSNPALPAEIHRYQLSGGFVASRRVGPHVYTVVHDSGPVSAPGIAVTLSGSSAAELERNYQAMKANIERTVDTLSSAYFLPLLSEQTAAGGEAIALDACQRAFTGPTASGTSFVSLVAFDLESLAPPTRTVIATRPGFVYASADALYLATDGVDGGDSLPTPYNGATDKDRSTIHKFTLEGVDADYAGSDWIPGHVLNQFSMDEHEGILRVATSSGYVPNPDVSSNVITLGESEQGFSRKGMLTGLAPSEDIRAVRFDGDQGFVVTFKKTDPLFVIDLAEPERPSVLGELKIPGFSTYMQRLDANHLLAVGFDADDHGSFAYFDGIQVQIFDVSDLAAPQLLHKTVIGTRGSGSEALMNHLAFNYYAPQQLLALPMTICEGGDDGVYGQQLTFSGLMVFDVSLEGGIVERGRMPFVETKANAAQPAPVPVTGAGNCGAWWTNSTSLVKRSIFMDDFALGISDTKVNAARLSALSEVVSSVSLTP